MAKINIVGVYARYAFIKLINLDTEYDANGKRTVVYYLFNDDGSPTGKNFTTTITGNPSEGAAMSISGLKTETTYRISATVYEGDTNGTILANLPAIEFTTADDTSVLFEGFSVYQKVIGSTIARVYLLGSNLEGCNYSIFVDGTKYVEGVVTSDIETNGVEIELKYFGTYTIYVGMEIGGTTLTSEEQQLVMEMGEEMPDPIKLIEVRQSSDFKTGYIQIMSYEGFIAEEQGFKVGLFNTSSAEEYDITLYSTEWYDTIGESVTEYSFDVTDVISKSRDVSFELIYTYLPTGQQWSRIIDTYLWAPEFERPEDFEWTYEKVSGGSFNLTADEWNALTARINEFRLYKKLPEYEFSVAEKNKPFTAQMYNQVREAIQEISGYGTLIPEVEQKQEITAYMLNVVVSELNAIP